MKRLILMALVILAIIAPETAARPIDESRDVPEKAGLYITVYDWGLGGINCDGDCTTTALTTTGDELLGWVAACPSAWLGRYATIVVTIWGESFWCVDAFGRPEDRVVTEIDGRRVYRIDIAYRPAAAHEWNNEYVPPGDWSVERRWMSEFESLRIDVVNSLRLD